MNHCHRCNSDYEKPGTCNCFAPQAASPPLYWPPYGYWPPGFVPYIPYPTTRPYDTIIRWGNNTDSAGLTTTGTVQNNIVNAADVKAPWSYTH